jgi:hypothetical protein
MTSITGVSTPVAVLTKPSDVLTYYSKTGPIPAKEWPYTNGADHLLLCIDTWGGGGTGGYGIYSKPALIGGGGGSGGFTRTYIQISPGATRAVEGELNIYYNGYTIYNNGGMLQSSAILAMPDSSVSNGGNYMPAQPPAIDAQSGAAGNGAPATTYIANPAYPYTSPPVFGSPNPFSFPFTTQQPSNNIIIIEASDIHSITLPGVAGQPGSVGGAGAQGIVAGGFSAGWGANGIGRDVNGVTRENSGPMTVVYIIATAVNSSSIL